MRRRVRAHHICAAMRFLASEVRLGSTTRVDSRGPGGPICLLKRTSAAIAATVRITVCAAQESTGLPEQANNCRWIAQRQTRTGIALWVTTRTVSPPRTSRARPRRPCDAMTITSHLRALASFRIASAGNSLGTRTDHETVRSSDAGSKIARHH